MRHLLILVMALAFVGCCVGDDDDSSELTTTATGADAPEDGDLQTDDDSPETTTDTGEAGDLGTTTAKAEATP